MYGLSNLELVLVGWGVVTVALIALALHRSILGFREEDRIFVGSEGRILEKEQTETLQQMARLDPWFKGLMWLSGALLLLAAGMWLYPGLAPLIW
jgi:hypothetical protein